MEGSSTARVLHAAQSAPMRLAWAGACRASRYVRIRGRCRRRRVAATAFLSHPAHDGDVVLPPRARGCATSGALRTTSVASRSGFRPGTSPAIARRLMLAAALAPLCARGARPRTKSRSRGRRLREAIISSAAWSRRSVRHAEAAAHSSCGMRDLRDCIDIAFPSGASPAEHLRRPSYCRARGPAESLQLNDRSSGPRSHAWASGPAHSFVDRSSNAPVQTLLLSRATRTPCAIPGTRCLAMPVSTWVGLRTGRNVAVIDDEDWRPRPH